MRLKILLLLTLLACKRAPEEPLPTPPVIERVEARVPEQKLQTFPQHGLIRLEGREHGPQITVELARTEAERHQGLMFRQQMADDHGMLFFMQYDNDWVFYMRNTYLRLDMVFIDRDWRVVGIVENVPPLTEDHRSVGQDSRYVLELTAHTAGKLGIHAGTRLIFEPQPEAH